jgi:hypothetical protein
MDPPSTGYRTTTRVKGSKIRISQPALRLAQQHDLDGSTARDVFITEKMVQGLIRQAKNRRYCYRNSNITPTASSCMAAEGMEKP